MKKHIYLLILFISLSFFISCEKTNFRAEFLNFARDFNFPSQKHSWFVDVNVDTEVGNNLIIASLKYRIDNKNISNDDIVYIKDLKAIFNDLFYAAKQLKVFLISQNIKYDKIYTYCTLDLPDNVYMDILLDFTNNYLYVPNEYIDTVYFLETYKTSNIENLMKIDSAIPVLLDKKLIYFQENEYKENYIRKLRISSFEGKFEIKWTENTKILEYDHTLKFLNTPKDFLPFLK